MLWCLCTQICKTNVANSGERVLVTYYVESVRICQFGQIYGLSISKETGWSTYYSELIFIIFMRFLKP